MDIWSAHERDQSACEEAPATDGKTCTDCKILDRKELTDRGVAMR